LNRSQQLSRTQPGRCPRRSVGTHSPSEQAYHLSGPVVN
jgi:hypothetical protein